ncbi:MAG TPA: sulfatase/phosphatase domain-containing protein, partial [Rhizobiaceae bacterium]|nr:sulfatase/phosphatase domain-containing protein [Rhizobiaceae bacterium]
VQPEGGDEVGELSYASSTSRKVPELKPGEALTLVDSENGQTYVFTDETALAMFKYQRYIKRYLRTVASIDENVGRLLDYLDEAGLADDTIVIYTSDQGFFLGEHGWYDKRFMYEESLRMPFLVRYPRAIEAGAISADIAMNVDFAPTFLDYAGIRVPSYMQGTSMRPIFEQETGAWRQDVAYHRYWMHKDFVHNIFAHYGVRDERYKLIYWYNDPLGQAGAMAGDEPAEWELFDCKTDPHELVNRAADPAHAGVFRDMLRKLDAKMAEIGDLPEHESARVLSDLQRAASPENSRSKPRVEA